MKILVVDDERTIVKGLKFNLENDGYEVECAYDGAAAVEAVRAGGIDLVLLDLMMPVMDGLEACAKIREISKVPIIMLTARGEDTDKIIGFEYGADDYITKPFNVMEVKVRVRAILRRAASSGTAAQQTRESAPDEPEESGGRVVQGRVALDPNTRNAFLEDEEVQLTAKEYDLIELMMKNPGRVYSRENLLNVVWGYEYPGDIRTVDVHIRRLRMKLERDPANPEHILRKWGVGYYFKP